MSINLYRLASLLVFSMATAVAHAQEQIIDFDVGTLKARGLSADVAEYFKTGKRFSPGMQRVAVVVNGVVVGVAQVMFDDGGQPCYDSLFFEKAGIKVPLSALSQTAQPCLRDLKQVYPQATVQLLPGQERIELLVPTDALAGALSRTQEYYSGGVAGVFNYDLFGLVNDGDTSHSSFIQGGTEVGANAGDWILRSRQTFSGDSENGNSLQHLYAYAQRSFNDNKQVFQGGELYASNSLFSTPQIIGVQAFPEGALRSNNRSSAVMVSGIAQSQARVEVRQAGVLIYSTLVPAGPFGLSNLPLVTANVDLQVTVIEQGGASHSFVVPYSTVVSSFVPREKGWSAAAGKIRNQGGADLQTDNLATFNAVTPLGSKANLSSGVLLSEKFRSLGFGLDGALPLGMSASGKLLASGDSRSGTSGLQFSTSLSVPLAQRLALSLSQSQQTDGYRDLSSVPARPRAASLANNPVFQSNRYSSQYSMGLGYSHATLGGFNLGYSHTQAYAADTQRYIGSWSKAFSNKLVVSATVERDQGQRQDTLAYVSLNIPLGNVRAGSTVQYANRSASFGATADQQVNEYLGYNLSTSRTANDQAGLAGTLRLLPKYTSVSLGASSYGESRSYSGTTSGGLVLHSGGLSLSPYPVQDTFALVDVPGLSGVRIDTPQGPVWTDWKGSAVAAYMPPYDEGRLELVTKDLPRNVDVQNGVRVSTSSRGSVSRQRFSVVTSRRMLLHVRHVSGQYVVKGGAVIDDLRDYVGTIGAEGSVFISDEFLLSRPLFVRSANNQLCKLQFQLPEKAPEDQLYEELDAVCRQTTEQDLQLDLSQQQLPVAGSLLAEKQ